MNKLVLLLFTTIVLCQLNGVKSKAYYDKNQIIDEFKKLMEEREIERAKKLEAKTILTIDSFDDDKMNRMNEWNRENKNNEMRTINDKNWYYHEDSNAHMEMQDRMKKYSSDYTKETEKNDKDPGVFGYFFIFLSILYLIYHIVMCFKRCIIKCIDEAE